MTHETGLAERILGAIRTLPEGTPVAAKELLHLGSREAVDQALSRLARRGILLRPARGVYVAPVRSRFGTRAPAPSKLIEGLARLRGETVTSSGAAAANALGLTTQVPIREVYLTSGPTRRLQVGAQTIELRHARPWELLYPHRPAGEAVRALAWLGPENAHGAAERLRTVLPARELKELAAARTRMPSWMAEEVSRLVAA